MPYGPDGNFLSQDAAIEQMVPFALDCLIRTAKDYGKYVTYKELGEAAKAATGITYDAKYYWVGRLLGPIVWQCKKEGWPPLSALVVHTEDDSVGEAIPRCFGPKGCQFPCVRARPS